mmetsp:Transcript_27744/g.41006  ORF Transcript_27744/g.41006 Transcript_27744/m.41006 type:complete len:96 (-) Transcript_27744:210-497(-)|eukprot:CAMPEP_0195513088 /NCGR_PEP_ID=MMETSP0794_2-20130614/4831_1 /TAXON_ID=515487 /ORGANISM="Stephanopyxis turris, Strain CCMP 815" /LENGTH=95 /DNA_ID=CAMNT_0040641015 /DNA_START=152 /DNA_END=439 /DNA_ORIENTATION=-
MTDPSSENVMVKVLLFASAREAAGNVSSIHCQVGANADTAKLRGILANLYPKLSPLVLDEGSITLALNEEYVAEGTVLPLKSGDVVALIPPISGG